MWKESVAAYFKILSHHLPRNTEEELQSGYSISGPILEPGATLWDDRRQPTSGLM
jgi:hypothetical protein